MLLGRLHAIGISQRYLQSKLPGFPYVAPNLKLDGGRYGSVQREPAIAAGNGWAFQKPDVHASGELGIAFVCDIDDGESTGRIGGIRSCRDLERRARLALRKEPIAFFNAFHRRCAENGILQRSGIVWI